MKYTRVKLKYLSAYNIIIAALLFSACEYVKNEPFDNSSIPEVVSFSEHVIPTFVEEDRCTKCHNGSVSPDLTAENAYFDLSGGNFIDTDSPENSYLYQKIKGTGSMAQYADEYQRQVILKWIEQGAEDN